MFSLFREDLDPWFAFADFCATAKQAALTRKDDAKSG